MIIIGLMSGTSVDGIDAAIVNIEGQGLDLKVDLLVGQTFPYSPSLREEILQVCAGKPLSMEELSKLDNAIASEFAQAVTSIIPDDLKVDLIGSHGQTVYHQPPQKKIN